MVTLAVDIFERIQAKFALFSFKAERVNLEVGLTTPDKVTMMFNLVQPITLQVLGTLQTTCEDGVPPLLAVLTLWDARVYISVPSTCFRVKSNLDRYNVH